MDKVLLLFKKDFTESTSLLKRKGTERDIIGLISSLMLMGVIYGVFVYVFKSFAEMYIATVFGNPSAEADRLFELTTAVYCAVFAVNMLVGVKKIHSSISDGKDCDVLIAQPISAWSIFFYKLLKIYFSQVISSALILAPVAIVLDVLTPLAGGAAYYFLLILSVVLVPVISCALAAVLSIPYTAVMRFIDSKFIVHLIVYVVLIAGCFWVYSKFLSTLTGLLQNGEIQFAFDRNVVNNLNSIALNLFPCNLFANMLFGRKVFASIAVIIAGTAVSGAITYFVVQAIYSRIIQKKLEGNAESYRKPRNIKPRSVLTTLLYKEFLMVLRTPSYAFQYFATTVTLPFMVFVCVNLLRSMMSTITIIDCDYELSMFVISMFTVLTNTFCTTNISRDGKMFAMLKTMPVKVGDIMKSKLIFCMLVSVVSVLTSSVALAIGGFLNVWQTVVVFLMAVLLSFSEIAYATRRDMKSPAFPSGDTEELVESNSNVSTLMLIGLLVSVVAGGGSVALTTILSITATASAAALASLAFVSAVIIVIFVLSCVYLFKGLREEYYNSEY